MVRMIRYGIQGSISDGRNRSALLDLPVVPFADQLGSVLFRLLEKYLFHLCIPPTALDAVAETAFGRARTL